jgi:hypothetical protein
VEFAQREPLDRKAPAATPKPSPDTVRGGRALVAWVARSAGNHAAAAMVRQLARYPSVAAWDQARGHHVQRLLGRPPNSYRARAVVQAVCDRVVARPGNMLSEREQQLKTQFSANATLMADAIVNHAWLSSNGAAMCHKQAISNIEEQLVAYANYLLAHPADATAQQQALKWATALTADPVDALLQYTLTTQLASMQQTAADAALNAAQKAQQLAADCTAFVGWANKASTNFYIGDTNANSAIHDFFDPHYGHDPSSYVPAPATPYSQGIYVEGHELAYRMTAADPTFGFIPSSPNRDNTGGYNQSSSSDRYSAGDFIEAPPGKYGRPF